MMPKSNASINSLLEALRAVDAELRDPLGWHHCRRLAERAQEHTGTVHGLLHGKLQRAVQRVQARLSAATVADSPSPHPVAVSPLQGLLQTLASHRGGHAADSTRSWRTESPRIQKFRHQLGHIRVQKQITQALAEAPQNAGPINSHMLVLRSLGWMRDISPDYLNRFMGHVDTLMFLESASPSQVAGKKAPAKTPAKSKKPTA